MVEFYTNFPISDPIPEDIRNTRHPAMANAPFLLQSKFNSNPLLQQTFHLPPLRSFPIKLSSGDNNAFRLNYSPHKVFKSSRKLRIKCFYLSHKPKEEKGICGNGGGVDTDLEAVAVGRSVNEVILRSIKNVLKALQKRVVNGVLLVLLFLYDHHHGCVALAASGGRMGGRLFSSSSSSSSRTTNPSSSSSSRVSNTTTNPSPSSSSRVSNTRTTNPSLSSSSRVSNTRTTNPSLSSSSRVSNTRTTNPSPSSSSRVSNTRTTNPSLSSSSRVSNTRTTNPSSSSSSRVSNTWTSNPELSSSVVVGPPAVKVESISHADGDLLVTLISIFMIIVALCLVSRDSDGSVRTATEKTSVLKLQIGLLGTGRSVQRDLNRIAETTDTSSPEGLSYILQETTVALLRHPDYCISGYSSVDVKSSVKESEERFNQFSIEERGKFDEETLVNVNNIRKQSASSKKCNGFRNQYIVITIIVAAGGVHKLPHIDSSAKLKEALQKLASIPSSKIMAAEVLWTPQNENDTLTEREFLENYSLLLPL